MSFPRKRARAGFGYGHQSVEDGIIKDGLWDVYNQVSFILFPIIYNYIEYVFLFTLTVPHGYVW